MVHVGGAGHGDKPALRARLLAARRGRSAAFRAQADDALAAHLQGLLEAGTLVRGDVVCGYVPVGTEPGSLAALDALRFGGVRVLLPLTPSAAGPLDWAEHTGELTGAPRGLREPTGPPLGTSAIDAARLVLVPALAVDLRGTRLGRGGGFYDRTLHGAAVDAVLVGVVGDDELLDAVPSQAHDVPLGWALTPGRGLVRLGPGQIGP